MNELKTNENKDNTIIIKLYRRNVNKIWLIKYRVRSMPYFFSLVHAKEI